MADQQGNNQGGGAQGADAGASGAAEGPRPVMGEFAPFVEDPTLPSADVNLIMSTLFGPLAGQDDQGAQGAQGSGGGQSAQGGNAQGGGQSSGVGSGAAAPAPGTSGQGDQAGSGQQGQQGQAAQGAGAAEELPPFSGAGNQQQPSGAQQQSQSQSQGSQPSGQASASGGAAQGQDDGLTPEARLRLHTLETTNAALTRQVQELIQRQPPTQQGSQGAGTQSGQQSGGGDQQGGGNVDPAQQAINLTVPPDLAQGLVDGEGNVSLPHLQHFASAIATIAYQRAVAATTQLIDNRISQYSSSQTQESEGERLAATYYDRFKDHNREIFHPLVADESRQMLAANPRLVWDDTALNALGARVNEKLRGLGFQIGMQQQGQGGQSQGQGGQQQQGQERGPVALGNGSGQGGNQQGNGAARPVTMLDSGTRPPQDRQADAGNFIKATLG